MIAQTNGRGEIIVPVSTLKEAREAIRAMETLGLQVMLRARGTWDASDGDCVFADRLADVEARNLVNRGGALAIRLTEGGSKFTALWDDRWSRLFIVGRATVEAR